MSIQKLIKAFIFHGLMINWSQAQEKQFQIQFRIRKSG